MKLSSLMIFLLLFGISITSAQEKINQLNKKGERVGVWKKYYNNGRIRYEGKFQSGKEIGVFNYYSAESSDFPVIVKTFNKKDDAAIVKFYTTNGVLQSEGIMKGKVRIGKWLYFHIDGKTIMTEENYENGVLNGVSKTFYKSGKITELLNYNKGILHGNIKRFADNGSLLDDLTYNNGRLHGLAKYYNVEGKLIYRGNYENDEKIGKWEFYNDGKQE